MTKPIAFPVFCQRYQLDITESDSRRLYSAYTKHLLVFNRIISELVVGEAIDKAKNIQRDDSTD